MSDTRPNPRKNADDAYDAFMSMGDEEFQGALFSILKGGCFEPEEDKGFRRALKDRNRGLLTDEQRQR